MAGARFMRGGRGLHQGRADRPSQCWRLSCLCVGPSALALAPATPAPRLLTRLRAPAKSAPSGRPRPGLCGGRGLASWGPATARESRIRGRSPARPALQAGRSRRLIPCRPFPFVPSAREVCARSILQVVVAAAPPTPVGGCPCLSWRSWRGLLGTGCRVFAWAAISRPPPSAQLGRGRGRSQPRQRDSRGTGVTGGEQQRTRGLGGCSWALYGAGRGRGRPRGPRRLLAASGAVWHQNGGRVPLPAPLQGGYIAPPGAPLGPPRGAAAGTVTKCPSQRRYTRLRLVADRPQRLHNAPCSREQPGRPGGPGPPVPLSSVCEAVPAPGAAAWQSVRICPASCHATPCPSVITPVIIAIIIRVYVAEDPGKRAPILDIRPAKTFADCGQVL